VGVIEGHGMMRLIEKNGTFAVRWNSSSSSSATTTAFAKAKVDAPKAASRGVSWDKLMALARRYPDAIQLGQGYPDYEGSRVAREAAADALLRHPMLNQYTPTRGLTRLIEALIGYYRRVQSVDLSEQQVTVLTSGTEGLFVATQAMIKPGDEVIVFQPCFPWYPKMIEMCGAKVVTVNLQPPKFAPSFEDLRKAISGATKVVVLNSPHNPTGHAYTQEELLEFSKIAQEHDLWILSGLSLSHHHLPRV